MYSANGAIFDVAYDINWSKVKESILWVKESGFEIGLHASYYSHKSPERLREEKESLEKISGTKVIGLRHHYWHLRKSPMGNLEFQEQAGFFYDSSFAFNEHLGFGLNFASGFYPLKSTGNFVIECMEIPVMCMEGNFSYNKGTKPEDIDKVIFEYLKQLKKSGRVGVFDWHMDISVPVNKRNKRAAYGIQEYWPFLEQKKIFGLQIYRKFIATMQGYYVILKAFRR